MTEQNRSKSILVVDDESDIRSLVASILTDEGFHARKAAGVDTAWNEISEHMPDLVLLDIWLEGSNIDGMELLKKIKRAYPMIKVIMISGHGNIETAIQSIKWGAYDFIEKPFKSDRLILTIQRALEQAALQKENEELRMSVNRADELLGSSDAIKALREKIEKVSHTNSRVLINGPQGCGKEVAARAIHKGSQRAEGPFITLNCAALHHDTFEKELFGYEETSGDGRSVTGLLEKAHQGTLFLDEVADMPMDVQAKMARVLQNQSFQRVNSHRRIEVDVRFIASTNRNLDQMIRINKFREDLFYRLNVVPLNVPALSQRTEDIPELADHFMQELASKNGIKPLTFSNDAQVSMQQYHWPGNVRQLRNVVEWLLIMGGKEEQRVHMKGWGKETIRAEALPPEIIAEAPSTLAMEKGEQIMGLPLREAREMFEKEYISSQINRFGGNVSKTADFIGMERSALHRKMKGLNIHSNSNSQSEEKVSDAS